MQKNGKNIPKTNQIKKLKNAMWQGAEPKRVKIQTGSLARATDWASREHSISFKSVPSDYTEKTHGRTLYFLIVPDIPEMEMDQTYQMGPCFYCCQIRDGFFGG